MLSHYDQEIKETLLNFLMNQQMQTFYAFSSFQRCQSKAHNQPRYQISCNTRFSG